MALNLSTYLWVLLFCLVLTIPLEFIFKLRVLRDPKRFIQALYLPFFVFIAWDILATKNEHWSFSKSHTSSITFAGLPIEELLFFIVIPLCSALTLESLRSIAPSYKASKAFFGALAFIYVSIGVLCEYLWIQAYDIVFPDRNFPTYTLFTAIGFSILVFYVVSMRKIKDLSYILPTISICLFFMVFVNGYLTKLTDPVVTYQANLGPRIFFDIPIEDFFYGSILIIWFLTRYEKVKA